MDGITFSGKAFCVVEDLRRFAEKHKGMTVAEYLRLRKIQKAEEEQFEHKIWSNYE